MFVPLMFLQEVSFLESKLNTYNLLRSVSSHNPPRDATVLLSLKSRGSDSMMLYRVSLLLYLRLTPAFMWLLLLQTLVIAV